MPRWLMRIGRIFYALGIVGIGIQHFIFGNFIEVMVPLWPAAFPGRPVFAYLVGAALVGVGLAILSQFHARSVAAWFGAALLLVVLIDDVPGQLMGSPAHLGVWTNALKAFALAGGAWVIARSLPESSHLPRFLEALMPYGKYFLPLTMVVFGIDHFLYPQFVSTLVPAWIPGHYFWTYFAGAALVAAGVAMITGVKARMAALMLGIMIFLWLLVLHIPRAIADPHSLQGNEWTSVFEALAFSGIAFVLAARPASE